MESQITTGQQLFIRSAPYDLKRPGGAVGELGTGE